VEDIGKTMIYKSPTKKKKKGLPRRGHGEFSWDQMRFKKKRKKKDVLAKGGGGLKGRERGEAFPLFWCRLNLYGFAQRSIKKGVGAGRVG